MSDYRDVGAGLIQSGDQPFVNQYGSSVVQPSVRIAPTGASDGSSTPGGGGAPTLSLSAYEIDFYATTNGVNPPIQTIELFNSGTGTIDFSLSVLPAWLTITPMSGTAPATLTLKALSTGISPGVSGANITITAPGAAGSPALLAVRLTVTADWNLPIVAPIPKKAWLGYFKTSTFNGEFTTTACSGIANACVVSSGDFGSNPAAQDYLTKQRTAATQIAALGGKIFIGADEAEILNMKGQWDQVGGISVSLEGATNTVELVEQRIRDARAIIRREGLQNRIFTVYIADGLIPALTKWIDGMNWLMLGVYLSYLGSGESESAAQGRIAASINAAMTRIASWIPTGGKVVLAAQAFDRYPVNTWDGTTLEYLQKAYADALRSYSQIHGIFWFCYDRLAGDGLNHGTQGYTNLIPWHQAIKQAIAGTPDLEVPADGPYGTLSVCNASVISGTAFDSGYPNQAVTVQIYDGPGVLGVNTNRVAQIATNASTTAFSLATPAALLDGLSHTVWVYVVSKSSPVYQVPLVGAPQTVKLDAGSVGVTVSGRSFLFKASPFIWTEATSFMAVKTLLNGGAPWTAMDAALAYWQAKGINTLRVLGMVGDQGRWAGWTFNPTTPNYYTAWAQLLTKAAARNMIIEACLFADTAQLPPYDIHTGRAAFVTEFMTTLGSYKNFTVEIANEPAANGFEDVPGMTIAQQLANLAQRVKAVDPARVVTLGTVLGNDADTSFNIPPTSYLAIHSDRETHWTWLTELFHPANQNVTQSSIPCVDNEPINATSGRSQQVDSSNARWYAYGLASQLRQLSSCFHYGDGTYSYTPNAATETLLTYWLLGRTDVSWSVPGPYFHGFYPSTGNSPFLSNGQILCIGRAASTTAKALVVAPHAWTPSLRPGWTATLTRSVADTDDGNTAFFFTLAYA